jgi:hypothetical protein
MKIFKFNNYLFAIMISCFIQDAFSQNNFNTQGVLIADTILFDGFIHVVGENKNKFILSYDSIYYDDVESFLLNGGSLFIPSIYFQTMLLRTNSKLKIKYNVKMDSIDKSNKIGQFTYRYKSNIITSIISSDEYNQSITDFLSLKFNRNTLIWLSSKMPDSSRENKMHKQKR